MSSHLPTSRLCGRTSTDVLFAIKEDSVTETPTTFWDLVKQELDRLPLEGALTKEDVEVWAWWFLRMVNQLEAAEWSYRGASIRVEEWMTLLVVRAEREGTRYVVFVNERTTTHCMRSFRKMFDEGRLMWRKDKFS